jgi:hypothetical protein
MASIMIDPGSYPALLVAPFPERPGLAGGVEKREKIGGREKVSVYLHGPGRLLTDPPGPG